MLFETLVKGMSILEKDEVRVSSKSNNMIHFKVKQSNGEWTDVWYRNRNNTWIWECNALTVKNKKEYTKKWGCVMNVKADKTQPWCSHTLACQMLLKRNNKEVEQEW